MKIVPRQTPIDAPVDLHHIIIRGIDRRMIFTAGSDHENFLKRLSNLLKDSQIPCYARALMNNHVHFLLRTGRLAIASMLTANNVPVRFSWFCSDTTIHISGAAEPSTACGR